MGPRIVIDQCQRAQRRADVKGDAAFEATILRMVRMLRQYDQQLEAEFKARRK